jgi:hypothetical protein
LLDMDHAALARRAVVSRDTVADFESGVREPTESNRAAIQRALEKSGVMLLEEDGASPNGAYATMRTRSASKSCSTPSVRSC